MPESNWNEDERRIEALFRVERSELQEVDSVLPQVQRRIAGMPMEKSPRRIAWWAVVSASLVAAGVFVGRRMGGVAPLPPLPQPAQVVVAVASGQDLTLQVGGTELVERIAAIVDHGAVAVVWSYRGQGMDVGSTDLADGRAGKYRRYTVREIALADGRTLVCSLFVPDAGVRAGLEPPSISTRAADHRMVALSTCPRAVPAEKLAAAIQSAGFDGAGGAGAEAIVRDIQSETH